MQRVGIGSWMARALAAGGLFAGLAGAPALAHAQQAPCRFLMGFQAMHAAIPTEVGACVDNEGPAANGDTQQHTAAGLLTYRLADHLTAFTNGSRTWIEGPYGLQSRLNSERYPWEAPVSTVAGATISCCFNVNRVGLNPEDPEVPKRYVLSDEQTGEDGSYLRTLRSYDRPDRFLTSRILREASHTVALATLNQISAQVPTSNRVLGQLNVGYQNDGSVDVGDASTFLEARDHSSILWVKDAYLLELDDASGDDFGEAIARAHAVENRLESILGLPLAI